MQKVILVVVVLTISNLVQAECSLPHTYCNNVFRIEAVQCFSNTKNKNRISTGFSYDINNKKVILTALHGVVGCRYINAKSSANSKEFMNLKIHLVNAKKDLAALISTDEAFSRYKAFQSFNSFIGKINTNKKRRLLVAGFPQGHQDLHTFTAHNHGYKTLARYLNNDVDLAFRNRKSPALTTQVLGLEIDGNSGLSGGGVVDEKSKKLLALFSGGRPNANNISWGITLGDGQWYPKSQSKYLERLVVPGSLTAQTIDISKGSVNTHGKTKQQNNLSRHTNF